MPKLSSYANVTPTILDDLVITDQSDSNNTKNVVISALATLLNAGATFTGDTTFDTDTLFVDSSNDRVGVGTITPAKHLHVHEAAGDVTLKLTNQTTGATTTDGFDISCAQTTSLVVLNQRENADIVVQLNGGERARFLASGGLTFNGDTAAANALDDYEEGTFTPTFTNAGSMTYTSQVGVYTKIGNAVMCDIEIDVNALGSASGSLEVAGLPFTSASNAKGTTSAIYGPSWSSTAANMAGVVAASGTTISMIKDNGDSGGITAIQHSDLGTGTIRFSLTYKV